MANIKLTDHNWHASGIYDTNQNKSQATINSDVATKMGSAQLETTSQNLSGGVNELKGRADTAEAKVDNLVTVSNTQPSSQYNKVWLPITVGEGTQVPTWAEHQSVVSDVSALNGAITSINSKLASTRQDASVEQSIFSEGACFYYEIGNIVLVIVSNLKFTAANSGQGAFVTGLPSPASNTAVGIFSYTNHNIQRLQVTTNGTLNNYWSDFAANEVIFGQFFYRKS